MNHSDKYKTHIMLIEMNKILSNEYKNFRGDRSNTTRKQQIIPV